MADGKSWFMILELIMVKHYIRFMMVLQVVKHRLIEQRPLAEHELVSNFLNKRSQQAQFDPPRFYQEEFVQKIRRFTKFCSYSDLAVGKR